MERVCTQPPRARLWIVILAAGQSRRMGSPKQMLPVGGGTLLGHVMGKALASADLLGATGRNEASQKTTVSVQVAVIASEGLVPQKLCSSAGLIWIVNAKARQGMSSSIHTAISHAEDDGAQAVLILLGDQPDIEIAAINQVASTFVAQGGAIIQARYEDGPGHPVLFEKRLFPELLQLQGDRGAREMLRLYRQSIRYINVPTSAPIDLDTPQDYAAYLQTKGHHT